MAMPPTPLSPPLSLPHSPSPTPTTPLEISQQFQRVDSLHQQLKLEAQRAQEFLIKLRRGELEAQTQAQLQIEQRQRDRDEAERRKNVAHDKEAGGQHGMCTCNCPHHPPATSSASSGTASAGQTTAHNRNSFNSNNDVSMPPFNLPTRVDEREVRDLEKRVRGLEGRVRGFEGLPPDREMALLEVERLRRELEGLARRREGLFEGLGCEEALRLGGGNGGTKPKGSAGRGGKEDGGEATNGRATRVNDKSARNGANGGKNNGGRKA